MGCSAMTNDPLPQDEVLNLQEASQYLRIKRRTLYVLAARGVVPGAKIGGQWRFRRSQLDGLFRGGQPAAAQGRASEAAARRPSRGPS